MYVQMFLNWYCRFATRLTGIKENEKFQKNGKNNNQVPGLKLVVDDAKKHHNVKYVISLHLLKIAIVCFSSPFFVELPIRHFYPSPWITNVVQSSS